MKFSDIIQHYLIKLDGQGRARREAARRRKSEWKVNVAIPNSSRSNGSWQIQCCQGFETTMREIYSIPSIPYWPGLRRGALTCVGWQVTLYDPIWQVTSRSCEMGVPLTAIHCFFTHPNKKSGKIFFGQNLVILLIFRAHIFGQKVLPPPKLILPFSQCPALSFATLEHGA